MPKSNVIKKSIKVPTVLIAGGAGFIGSHLAEALLEQGARVLVVDDFSTGRQKYVDKLLSNPYFALFNADINQGIPSEIESVDYVIHLAALEEYLYSPEFVNLDLLLTNGIGTKNLLDLANKSGAKFMLVSSIDVYMGMMSQLDINNYFGTTTQEERMYSLTEAKRFAEALVWEYFKKNHLNSRIVRIPEIYGPDMSLASAGNIGQFLKDLIEGKNITIYGDGNNKLFYLYIKDAVSGMLKALFGDNTSGNIYSLVGDSYAELEIAFLVKSIADRKVDITFAQAVPSRSYQKNINPDTYNIRDLNWKPKISLKEGLIETLKSLGYETNAHAFKPAKLISQKKEEKLGMVSSLAPAPLTPISLEDSLRSPVVLKQVKEVQAAINEKAKKIELSKIHIPKLPQFKFQKAAMVLAVLLSISVVFVALPSFQAYTYINSAQSSLNNTRAQLTSLDAASAVTSAKDAYVHLSKASNAFAKLRWLFAIGGKHDVYTSYSRLLSSVTYFSRAVHSISLGVAPATNIVEVLKPTSQLTLDTAVFNDAKLAISNAKNYLQLAETDLVYVDTNKLPGSIQTKATEYKSTLSLLTANIDPLLTAFASLPDTLGITSQKKYLVLFMNNNELRPTGGFVGSYAIITMQGSKITDLQIDDVYNPDGQLDVQDIVTVQPKPIETFLKEDKLYMRNANWHPDFTVSAKSVADLYTKATGEKVDGVVALDLYFVKYLLEITGPVYLTAFNEEISADNFYERTQLHSDFNYEEGVSQKKSFMSVLSGKLLEKIFSIDKTNAAKFVGLLARSFEERHLMVYVFDSSIDSVLSDKKLDGGLVNVSTDYLNVVNANLGGTKSNYFVTQQMDYKVKSMTRDGLLRGELTITYTHTGSDSAWPGGPYADYVRVLTQKGSKLTGAKITNKTLAKDTDIFDKVVIDQVNDYTSFETNFVLNPKETIVLTYNYDLPVDLAITSGNKSYSLYWQKQPGTQDDQYNFTFDYPFGMNVVNKEPDITKTNEHLQDTGLLNTDKYYKFIFQ